VPGPFDNASLSVPNLNVLSAAGRTTEMPTHMFGHAARLARNAVEDPACIDAPVDPQLLAWRHDGIDPEPGLLLVEMTTYMLNVRTSLRASQPSLASAAYNNSNSLWHQLPEALSRRPQRCRGHPADTQCWLGKRASC